jgi:DnaJ like chaperone protein
MGWFGKLTFGSVGLFFGGPLGAIAGAALGHHLVDKKERPVTGAPASLGPEQTQAAYFVSMFSILGKLAKIDGVVSKGEIRVVNDFMDTLKLTGRQKQFAREIFNQAKNSSYSIEDFAAQFYRINRQPAVLLSFLDVLFQVASADQQLHPAEETALERVKAIFRLSDQQFNNIKVNYFKDVDRYYKILNCTPESSDAEIRANYKKLVKDFHPDSIVSKGLPEEFTDFATKRFREIQEAYNEIRKERGLQ